MQNPLFVFYFEVFIFLNLRSIILLSAVAPPRHYRKLRQHDTNNGGLQTLRPQYHRCGEVVHAHKATSRNVVAGRGVTAQARSPNVAAGGAARVRKSRGFLYKCVALVNRRQGASRNVREPDLLHLGGVGGKTKKCGKDYNVKYY